MNNEILMTTVLEFTGNKAECSVDQYDMLNVVVESSELIALVEGLKNGKGFIYLTDICAAHYPERVGSEFEVVYHLHNLKDNVRIRFKVYTSIEQPEVYTATGLFAGANWMERETYDFFGIQFVGHPKLKRILNVDEMDYFPLRKEFPLEDQTRIDKDDEMFGRD